MKTVWDAVSQLKGDLINSVCFRGERVGFLVQNDEGSLAALQCRAFIGGRVVICSVEEFNELVAEMETNFGKCSKDELAAYQGAIENGTATELEVESKVDYTSEEFWKGAPEGRNFLLVNKERSLCEFYYQMPASDGGKGNSECWANYENEALNLMSKWELIERPQPKPVYTQEMYDKGEKPKKGMICLVDDIHRELLLPIDSDDMGVIKVDGAYYIICRTALKPIDNRTKKEKAIDDIRLSCGFNKLNSMEKELLAKAYDTWSKGNE